MPRPNDLDDQQLLQGIAEGDSSTLRELHAKTARPLHSMAMKILTGSAEAEEVIKTCLCLFGKMHTNSTLRKPRFSHGWLS